METKISAGAVVFLEEEKLYLLLHYQAGHWDFPKGNVEEGESLKETAKREIGEETSIKDIEFLNGFQEETKYFYQKKDKIKKELVLKRVVFFLTKTKTKDVKTSFEHKGFEWLDYDKARERITFNETKKVLEKAHLFLGKKSN